MRSIIQDGFDEMPPNECEGAIHVYKKEEIKWH